MKQYLLLFLILFCITFLLSCSHKKEESEVIKDSVEKTLSNTEELQNRANSDINFAKSTEYATVMERANIEFAKKTAGMDPTERLLLEYDLALNGMKTYTEKLHQNPSLLSDKNFVRIMQLKADRVRTLHQELNHIKLNDEQQLQFNELNHRKI